MFQPIFHSFAFLFLTAAALSVMVWRTAPRKNGRKILSFILLRLGVVFLLAWVLARPTFSIFETETYPGSVLILADTSRSMQVKDGTESRFQTMKDALKASADSLKAMMKNVETQAWTYDRDLVSAEISPKKGTLQLPAAADGEETALGAALQNVLKKASGRKILGVVLLGDGAQRAVPPRDTLPQTAALNLQRLGIPLFTVCFGSNRQENRTLDAAVEDFLVEQRVFVDTETVISGKIRLDGLENQDVPVELLVETPAGGMEVAARTSVRAGSGSESVPVQLSWIPKEIGEVKVSLRVPPRSGEISAANNQLDAFVSVVKSGLRVLYLEGAFRPESGFLRRSLDAAEEIQLEMIRVQNPDRTSDRTSDRSPLRTPERHSAGNTAAGTFPDPSSEAFPAASSGKLPMNSGSKFSLTSALQEDYAVIILGDVDADCFQPEDLTLLAQKIEAGTGFLTLGGLHNYGPGGYAATPLAQILPVEMSPEERLKSGTTADSDSALNSDSSRNSAPDSALNSTLNSDPDSASKTQWSFPLRMRPTAAGRRHFALALDSETAYSAQLWEKLPPLDGANRFQGLKPGAVVLASDFTPGKMEVPLLVEHSFGRGRVMTFTADSTWRWKLAGFEDVHKRFWRQLIFWLANKDAALDGSVTLILPERRFTQEQKISFRISVHLSNGETPVPPSQNTETESWTAFLKSSDGKETPVTLMPDRETMRGEISQKLPPGDYTLRASVTHRGQKIGDAQCRFQVYHHDLELNSAQAEPELMAALALQTGGEAVAPEALSALWKRLAENREELKIEREIVTPIWDRWPFLTLILLLLCTEWFLRKYRGFV